MLFIFKAAPKISHDKKIICLDSYEINNPTKCWSKKFLEKCVFLSEKKSNNGYGVPYYYFLNLQIFYKFILKYIYYFKKFYYFLILRNIFFVYYFKYLIAKNIIEKNKIKIFVTSHIYTSESSSFVAAIHHQPNGLALGFNYSFAHKFNCRHNISAYDYFFSFSGNKNEIIKYSRLKNILEYGYILDYKIKSKLSDLSKVVKNIKSNGANFIIGLFDQGSSSDKRYNLSHEISGEGYIFLLTKLIKNKNLGLIIKPKKVTEVKLKIKHNQYLLEEAQKTGRLFLVDTPGVDHHTKNFDFTPGRISEHCDLTIHDTFLAATAGFESAWNGKRSVFFDYYGTSNDYNFKKNNLKIVYNNWIKLWDEIEYLMKNQDSRLGSWGDLIYFYDKYRDGQTINRIESFIFNKLKNLKI